MAAVADSDFVEDNDETVEISLNAVGKASQLKVRKIKIKRRYTF